MKSFFTKPFFWISFTIISILAGITAFHYFPQANPIIHLNLTMNRNQALSKADALATQFALGPANALAAAQFHTDELVKTFIELEAGGKDALVAMMEHNLYQPYHWIVRRFKPFEHHEVSLYFTPDGTPYGFKETISENIPGINYTSAQAQLTAETFAQANPWSIQLTEYTLVENSQEIQPSGRIDHTFMYERTTTTIGEGFYRLKIVVRGNHVSELSHNVKVPHAFNQRYEQMRSANETIYYAANFIVFLLYIIGCCFIGLVVLTKQHFVIWRTPFYWGLFIATLVALNIPNQLPLQWMEYNTAHSPLAFLFQQGISILYAFIFFSIACSIIFMAAESLSRRAFGHHVQLWHIYNAHLASSYTIFGYSIAAYLLVPILLCYTVLFYVVTSKWLGWWSPSSALSNPNILATYFPWLESISVSLQAGFLEECLFRAIPLASAALLGTKFGKRSWWIAGAFILQALIFGAAHSNYPQQPAYARIVELLVTSSFFSSIYLAFGLLPGIITHFIYDVFWFALPIFVSTAPGALLNKLIIVLGTSIPLLIIIMARIKKGSWYIIPSSMFNAGWQPTPPKPVIVQQQPKQSIPLQKRIRFALYVLGIIGLIAWSNCTRFVADAPSFTTTRNTIAAASNQIADEKNIDRTAWYFNLYPFINYEHSQSLHKQHRFVWQEGGKEIYHELINTYLKPPYWKAHYMKFEGPLTDRAEEHEFNFKPNGSFFRYAHTIPQARPGATLTKSEAQQRALTIIEQQFHLTPSQLREVSTVADKQPQRLDWVVTYAPLIGYPLSQGEGRITIKIAGDEVLDVTRSVHVPEQWGRTEENHILITTIIKQLSVLATWLIVMIGAFFAVLQWHALLPSLWIFCILASIFLFELGNAWPLIVAHFTTSQPFYDQAFRSLGISAIFLLLRAAGMAVAFSFVTYAPVLYHNISFRHSLVCGISLGFLISGIQSALIYFLPSVEPLWPNYTPLQFLMPFTAGMTTIILNYLALTILLFLCVICMNKTTRYGKQKMLMGILLSMLFGYIGAGLLFASNLQIFSIAGLILSFFFYTSYFMVLRFDYPIIPIITATAVLLENTQQFFFNAYPLARIVIILSSCSIAIIAWLWSRKMHTT